MSESKQAAGGKARAAKLTPEQRSEIAKTAANRRWAEEGVVERQTASDRFLAPKAELRHQVAAVHQPPPPPRPATDFIATLALHPDLSPEKLTAAIQAWTTMQEWQHEQDERQRKQDAEAAFYAAKAAMQTELKPVARETANPHTRSKFANLGDIIAACAPVWGRHGFAVDFDVVEEGDRIRTIGYLRHQAGHVQEFRSYASPPDTSGSAGKANKTLIQGQQSTVTYQQRNLLLRMIPIATVDDPSDDDGAGEPVRSDHRPPPPPRPTEESDWDRLARGDEPVVARLIQALGKQPDLQALERLVESVSGAVDAAPDAVQTRVAEALRAAREGFKRAAGPATPAPDFGYIVLDPFGASDGEVLRLDAWIDEFLGHWDAAAKRPEDQTALLEHNADALAAARAAGAAAKLADVKPRQQEGLLTPAQQPDGSSGRPAEENPAVQAWVNQQLDAIAPLTKTPEDFATLQLIVSQIVPKMRDMERTHPGAHKRVKHAFEAKWAAIKPDAPSGRPSGDDA
jgi:hypothetical protein